MTALVITATVAIWFAASVATALLIGPHLRRNANTYPEVHP